MEPSAAQLQRRLGELKGDILGCHFAGDMITMPLPRARKILEWVKARVTDMDVVETVWAKAGSHIVLELKSNVQRTLSWPRGV
jgi:hypothetical protein